jgi:hypothetical protein
MWNLLHRYGMVALVILAAVGGMIASTTGIAAAAPKKCAMKWTTPGWGANCAIPALGCEWCFSCSDDPDEPCKTWYFDDDMLSDCWGASWTPMAEYPGCRICPGALKADVSCFSFPQP